jgi:UDP-2-acetamido-3-amino-2,3-dideoxy-glucuronate N-acetyltransferase
MRTAVMGAGKWGRNLIRVLGEIESVDLGWIADPDSSALDTASAAAPDAKLCDDISRALDDIDLAFVATPSSEHVGHARFLLAHGKDVFVEKPFAMSLKEAVWLAAGARASGSVLMVGHQMLYHPGFQKLESLVREGALGRLQSIQAERAGVLDLSKEPGVLWAYGPHDVAMVLALSGESPDKVTSVGRTLDRSPDTATTATISLEP